MDTLQVIQNTINKQLLTEHVEVLYNLINALTFCKKALSLIWVIGNIFILSMIAIAMILYFIANKKLKEKEKKVFKFPKLVCFAYPVIWIVTIIFAKISSGNLMVILLTFVFAFGALIYWKYDLLFKRSSEKHLPVGWLVISIFMAIFQLLIFNTFPQLVKVDPHAEQLLRVVSHNVFSDSTMYEAAE